MCGWDLGVWIKGRNYGGSNFLKPLHCMHSSLDWAITYTGLAELCSIPKLAEAWKEGVPLLDQCCPSNERIVFQPKKSNLIEELIVKRRCEHLYLFYFQISTKKTPHYYPTGIFYSFYNLMSWYNFQRMEVSSPFHRLQKCRKLVPEMASGLMI